jgi:hypothetical protein
VDTTEVARARVARAVDRRDDSMMNMNGESVLASARQEREKILRRRKVCVSGPT